jgi:hypothetical protein
MDPSLTASAAASSLIADTPHADERKEWDPAPQPMEIDGQGTISGVRYHGVPATLMVYHALVCVLSVDATDASGQVRTPSAKYSGRHQLCEGCNRRLSEMKGKKYSCPPGLMCHDCYNKEHPSARNKRPASAMEPPTPKRPRRTQSDPGEPASLARKRIQAQPPPTVRAPKKTRMYTPAVDPSLLLDQAHTQRLALMAAEKSGAHRVDHPLVFDCD